MSRRSIVSVDGRAARATARLRRGGELARAVPSLPAVRYRVRCDIPGEMDPVLLEVAVQS